VAGWLTGDLSLSSLFLFGIGDTTDDLKDEFEMQADAILPGQTVVIVDDIIATGVHLHRS
jgi:hypoxanthine phosphoribosyltransferase